MRRTTHDQIVASEDDVISLLMKNPQRVLKNVLVDFEINDPDELELTFPDLIKFDESEMSVDEFDSRCQSQWKMPVSYREFDIVQYVIEMCQTDDELERVGIELQMYQDRDMFMLLRYLKYLVDIMRDNDIVWGVGRGSSVSSYVLYLMGIHKINSLKYGLDISEFLK